MENHKDDGLLFERDYHQPSFLRKKVSLTVPVCLLLIVVFLSSAFVVLTISFYWTGGAVCYVNNNDEQIKPEQSTPRPVYYSRPKRSPTPKKNNVPCFAISCCTTFNSSTLWTGNRLPTNVYPVEYLLELELFHLNEPTDQYSGTVDILIEVQSPTNDIILHGSQLLYSDVTVSQRSSPNSIPLTVDCILSYPETQTVTIHLVEQLQVGESYDVRIAFFRALSVHGTGIFENQFNTDQFGMS